MGFGYSAYYLELRKINFQNFIGFPGILSQAIPASKAHMVSLGNHHCNLSFLVFFYQCEKSPTTNSFTDSKLQKNKSVELVDSWILMSTNSATEGIYRAEEG